MEVKTGKGTETESLCLQTLGSRTLHSVMCVNLVLQTGQPILLNNLGFVAMYWLVLQPTLGGEDCVRSFQTPLCL